MSNLHTLDWLCYLCIHLHFAECKDSWRWHPMACDLMWDTTVFMFFNCFLILSLCVISVINNFIFYISINSGVHPFLVLFACFFGYLPFITDAGILLLSMVVVDIHNPCVWHMDGGGELFFTWLSSFATLYIWSCPLDNTTQLGRQSSSCLLEIKSFQDKSLLYTWDPFKAHVRGVLLQAIQDLKRPSLLVLTPWR